MARRKHICSHNRKRVLSQETCTSNKDCCKQIAVESIWSQNTLSDTKNDAEGTFIPTQLWCKKHGRQRKIDFNTNNIGVVNYPKKHWRQGKWVDALVHTKRRVPSNHWCRTTSNSKSELAQQHQAPQKQYLRKSITLWTSSYVSFVFQKFLKARFLQVREGHKSMHLDLLVSTL